MTRQTRVGLLLGLAVIVVFGVVLGELTGTEGQPAPAAEQVIAPDYYQTRAARPIRERSSYRMALQPDDPSPVPRRMTRREPVATLSERRSDSRRDVRMELVAPQERTQRGELESAMIRRSSDDAPQPAPQQVQPQPIPARQAPRQIVYTVKAGETLYDIAETVYGRGNGHRYKAIYEANRDHLPNAHTVREGQRLRIPAPAGSQATEQDTTRRTVREANLRELPAALAESSPRRIVPTQYVVRRGDTLTDIARKLYGSANEETLHRIYQANRSVMSSPDHLVEGTVLRIPR